MRGAGPIGYPGAAEVVNMRAAGYLIKQGRPCAAVHRRRPPIGHLADRRRSSTPRRKRRRCGGLALLKTGDRVRIDLNTGSANVLISDAELMERRAALEAAGGYAYPASQTPWQEIQRAVVGQMNTGAILEGAEKYQRIAQTMGLPRDNHSARISISPRPLS
jgi:dihydroxy-acid dehydratase